VLVLIVALGPGAVAALAATDAGKVVSVGCSDPRDVDPIPATAAPVATVDDIHDRAAVLAAWLGADVEVIVHAGRPMSAHHGVLSAGGGTRLSRLGSGAVLRNAHLAARPDEERSHKREPLIADREYPRGSQAQGECPEHA
jgi:hypothetical protein